MANFIIAIISVLVIILFIRQSDLQKEILRQKKIILFLQQNIELLTKKVMTKTTSDVAETVKPATTADVAEAAYAAETTPVEQAVKTSPVKAEAPVNAPKLDSGLQVSKIITKKTTVVAEAPVNTQPIDTELQASKIITKKTTVPPAAVKRKSFLKNENWVGVSLFNRLGALLIIIGTIAIAAFEGFPAVLRTSILFALALGVIVLGEIMNRKKPTTVSTGVSATGVALTYVAIAASFFALETLGMYSALIACIAATALGIFLATRYKAQVIGCFALIGGYLPIFSLDPLNNPMTVGIMVYFVLLSLFSLALALTHKWSVMNIIGFVLTVIGVSYLGWRASPEIALIYACFAFLLYTALPLIAAYRTKEAFGELDVWLIILNTFVSSVVIFLIAYRLDVQFLHAYLCLAFTIIYAVVATWMKRAFRSEKMQTIFTLTSIAFLVLFVPFFFDMRWFAVVWLAQAVVFVCYGILQGKKLAEYSGLSILGIAIIAFLSNSAIPETVIRSGLIPIIDIFANGESPEWQFTFDYIFFTAGLLAILGCYIAKGRQWRGYEQVFKFIAFANLWVFAMYMIIRYIPGIFGYSIAEHLLFTSWAVVTFVLAYLYYKIKLWADNVTRILANIIHFAGIFGLLISSLTLGTNDSIRLMINLFAAIIGFAMVIHYHLTEKRSGWTVSYKNINIINLWLMILWSASVFLRGFFGMSTILMVLTFATAFAITRIPAIADNGTRVIAVVIHVIGLVWLWVFNSWPYSNVLGLMALNGAAQIVALIALSDAINLCSVKRNFGSFKIVILSAYFLLAVTQTMIVQGNITFNSALISIMYAVAAFAWIIIGFRLRNKPIRKAGLFLSMAAVAKLLIVDTWGLSTEMRIVSYISLGLILMLISFVYQKLSKRLED